MSYFIVSFAVLDLILDLLILLVVLGGVLFTWVIYRSKQTLQLLTKRLNDAQQAAHFGNWEWDIATNALWWSDEIFRIFGVEVNAFTPTYERFLSFIDKGDVEKVQAAVSEALKTHTHYEIEHRIVRSDGQMRYVREEGYTVYDTFGKPLKMHGTVQDITERKMIEAVLRESEKKYKDLVENAMIGVYTVNDRGVLLFANKALLEMFDYTSIEAAKAQKPFFHYAEPRERKALMRKIYHEGMVRDFELMMLDQHEKPFPVILSAAREGSIVSGMMLDMREIKKSHAELEKLSQVVRQIADTVIITDLKGQIEYVNPAFERVTGFTMEETLGMRSCIVKSGVHKKHFYEMMWDTILSGKVFRHTMVNKRKNGEIFYEDKTIAPLKDKKGEVVGFVATGKDVTQEKLAQIEMERLATQDKLTGIYNRHKFEALFESEAERSTRFGQPLSLILIDIDHFKNVNDTYGHEAGDTVLIELAQILSKQIRRIDVFARWGGEEFLIMLPHTGLLAAKELAEKLRKAVESKVFSQIEHLTISMGVAERQERESLKHFFKRVDSALYSAKEQGRNRVVSAEL